MERLGKETLDLCGRGKTVSLSSGDNSSMPRIAIMSWQILVPLEHPLHTTRHGIMLLADDLRRERLGTWKRGSTAG